MCLSCMTGLGFWPCGPDPRGGGGSGLALRQPWSVQPEWQWARDGGQWERPEYAQAKTQVRLHSSPLASYFKIPNCVLSSTLEAANSIFSKLFILSNSNLCVGFQAVLWRDVPLQLPDRNWKHTQSKKPTERAVMSCKLIARHSVLAPDASSSTVYP